MTVDEIVNQLIKLSEDEDKLIEAIMSLTTDDEEAFDRFERAFSDNQSWCG